MVINVVSVQYNRGLLPDIMLLTRCGYIGEPILIPRRVFRKNLNASKPSNYQSKGLGGNIGGRYKNSTWY